MTVRTRNQRVIAAAGLAVIVGGAIGVLALVGVIGGSGGGTTDSGVPIEKVELVDPPRSPGQHDLEVGTSEGQLAPDFVISDFEGARHRLSDFRGQVVYVNFWASWCAPCIAELAEIQELQARNPESVTVLAVNREQSLGEAEGWLAKLPTTDGGKGVSFTVNGMDPDDTLYDRMVRLKDSMPVSIFINGEGVVTSVHNGAIRLPDMERAVGEARASTSAAFTY